MWTKNNWNAVENNYTVVVEWTRWNEIWQKRIFNVKWWESDSILEIATDRLGEIPMSINYWYKIVSIIEDTKWKTVYQSFTEDEV